MTADTVIATRGRITGDHHADTATLPIDDIAARLMKDLNDVRDDGMFPSDAEFSISTDKTGTVPVLRVTAACDTDVSDAITGIAAHLAAQVFGLASHYNEVNLDQPDQARFLQHVTVRCAESASATLVGVMVQTA